MADEIFHGEFVRGILLKEPSSDIVRVQDVGLSGMDDPFILNWAAEYNRIIVTHDSATMQDFAYKHVVESKKCWECS